MTDDDFLECTICVGKKGLCDGCTHNRKLIHALREELIQAHAKYARSKGAFLALYNAAKGQDARSLKAILEIIQLGIDMGAAVDAEEDS